MKSESRRPRPLCWVALTMAVLGMAFPLYANTEIVIGPGKNPKTEIPNLNRKGHNAAVAFVPQKGYTLKECKKKSRNNSFLLWKTGKSLGHYSVDCVKTLSGAQTATDLFEGKLSTSGTGGNGDIPWDIQLFVASDGVAGYGFDYKRQPELQESDVKKSPNDKPLDLRKVVKENGYRGVPATISKNENGGEYELDFPKSLGASGEYDTSVPISTLNGNEQYTKLNDKDNKDNLAQLKPNSVYNFFGLKPYKLGISAAPDEIMIADYNLAFTNEEKVLQQCISQLNGQQKGIDEKLSRLKSERQTKTQLVEEKEKELANLIAQDPAVKNAMRQAQNANKALQKRASEVAEAQENVTVAEKRLKAANGKKAIGSARKRLNEAQARLSNAQEKCATAQKLLEDANKALTEAKANATSPEIKRLNNEISNLNDEIPSLTRQIKDLESQSNKISDQISEAEKWQGLLHGRKERWQGKTGSELDSERAELLLHELAHRAITYDYVDRMAWNMRHFRCWAYVQNKDTKQNSDMLTKITQSLDFKQLWLNEYTRLFNEVEKTHDEMDSITQHGRTKQDVWDKAWASEPHPQDRDKEIHGEGVCQ